MALFEYLIRTYTNRGEIVLDNTIGAGTTAVAAIRSDRRFIGMEIDPTYHTMAVANVTAERQAEAIEALQAARMPEEDDFGVNFNSLMEQVVERIKQMRTATHFCHRVSPE